MVNTNFLDEKLNELAAKLQVYDRPLLTEQIKFLFAQLFKDEKDCFCYANGIKGSSFDIINGENEFIYDLVVLKERKHDDDLVNEDYIVDTLLVLESELDDRLHSVLVDYQKLLLCNADEKVMLFRCHSTEFERWSMYLEKCALEYRKSNGRFHLIARLNDKLCFKRKTFTI